MMPPQRWRLSSKCFFHLKDCFWFRWVASLLCGFNLTDSILVCFPEQFSRLLLFRVTICIQPGLFFLLSHFILSDPCIISHHKCQSFSLKKPSVFVLCLWLSCLSIQASKLVNAFKSCPEKVKVIKVLEPRLCRMTCAEAREILRCFSITDNDRIVALDCVKR